MDTTERNSFLKRETLPPDPNLFFARIILQIDPIINFWVYYLTEANLKFEGEVDSTYFQRHPPISLSIRNFNLKAEAAAFVEQESLRGTLAETVVQMMPEGEGIKFQILVEVNAQGMPLPQTKLVSVPGFPNPVNNPHLIEVVFDKTKGFIVNCKSLTHEQVNFCLQLLIKSLDFTLSKARKGKIQAGNEFKGRKEDSIVFDNYFLTATDADLQNSLFPRDREKYEKIRNQKISQLKYLKATLEEILGNPTLLSQA
jgi:hypothetical protein